MKKAILGISMLLAAYGLSAQKSLSAKDIQFTETAYRCGLMKIRLGELTASKAKSDSVKVLGRQLVMEHTKANEQLKTIAASKNIILSDSLNRDEQRQYNDLASRWGAYFDKGYVQLMVTEHEKAITLFKTENEEGSDEEVRNWASMTLPVLKHHLMVSQDLAVDLDRKNQNQNAIRQGSSKIGTGK